MKLKALCSIAVLLFTVGAHASSHSAIAREATLVKLENSVQQQCGTWSLPFTRCSELKSLVSGLYRDPLVATKTDLVRLERIEKLGLEVSGAKGDLAVAIGYAKALYTHVITSHDGVWEQAICGPTRPA